MFKLHVGTMSVCARLAPGVLTVERATQIRERVVRRLMHVDLHGAKNNNVLPDWKLFHAGALPRCTAFLSVLLCAPSSCATRKRMFARNGALSAILKTCSAETPCAVVGASDFIHVLASCKGRRNSKR